MNMTIWKEMTFEAAHRLPNVPPEHKCSRMHGHSWTVRVYLTGPWNHVTGWVADFDVLGAALKQLHQALDHRTLNDIAGLENPTSENVAIWVKGRMDALLQENVAKLLSRIEVQETGGCGVVLRTRD